MYLNFCFFFRNEVWRYDTQFGHVPARKLLLRNASTGMGVGLALALGTILLEMGYNKVFGKHDAHGHGHGHGHH